MTEMIEDSPLPAPADLLPGPVLLLGAPGVGKGTQAQLLMASFGVPQISTGDLLRQHVQEGTELGRRAHTLMDKGQLVPDEVVNGMVAERLTKADTRVGFILDGFPRTEIQATWLDAALAAQTGRLPLVAIQISVGQGDLMQRITGRRTCPACKRIFNIYTHPPQTNGLCDFDQTALTHRSDDTESAFHERMTEYTLKTAPVIEHYRSRGCFREVPGLGTLREVERTILATLVELRSTSAESSCH